MQKTRALTTYFFKFSYVFYSQVSYKKIVDPCFKLKSTNELAPKLKKLTNICQENFKHTQKWQKRHHNKYVKLKSYITDNKI